MRVIIHHERLVVRALLPANCHWWSDADWCYMEDAVVGLQCFNKGKSWKMTKDSTGMLAVNSP